MSTSRREVVLLAYELWNGGEQDALAPYLSEDVVFDWSRRKLDPMVVSGEGDWREAVKKLGAAWSEWGMEIEEVIEHEQSVIAFVHVTGVGAASGIEVDARVAHVWTFGSDGLVERMEYFPDRGAALAEIGARG